MMGWGYMGTGGLAMVLVWSVALLLLFGTAMVIVLVEAVRRHDSTPRTRRAEPRTTAEDELELRYARGEIDATTLVQRRAALRQP
jgi:uncharacterized membrane protein